MLKSFSIEWYAKEKYREPVHRHTSVKTADAKAAVEVFVKTCGNLKKNEIVQIQEYNDKGPVGEPIVPEVDSSIIPTRR